jgi:YVTN family beta-propeller protein
MLSIALLLSCSDGSEPSGPATLRLTIQTSGEDLDLDGYRYTLDGNAAAPLESNDTITIAGLAGGTHALVLTGVAENCALPGGLSRSIALTSGDTTLVQLRVSCVRLAVSHPQGTVQVIPVPGAPYGVAVSSTGVIYAAQIGSNSLARGNLATMSFTDSVTVGMTPPHVVFNPAGTIAYATLQTGRGLAVVDVATNSLLTTLPLASDGFNLIVAPNGARVYATTADGTLYVVNTASNTIVTTLSVGAAANGLAFNSDGSVLYVSSRDAGTVVAINPATNTILRTYIVPGMPQRLAVSADGNELYVANEVTGLDVVDLNSGAISSINFGSPGYGLGLTPDDRQLYVLLPETGEVRVLDRSTRAPLKTLFVGGIPRNVVFTKDGRTGLITTEEAVVFVK